MLFGITEHLLFIALRLDHSDGTLKNVVDKLCPPTVQPSAIDNLYTLSFPFLTGWLLIFTGFAIHVLSFCTLRDNVFEHKLVKNGPFSIVRHPAHLSLVIVGFGILMIRFDPYAALSSCGVIANYPLLPGIIGAWIMIAAGCVYWLIFIQLDREENELKKVLGEKWDNYCKEVPYKVIPGLLWKPRGRLSSDVLTMLIQRRVVRKITIFTWTTRHNVSWCYVDLCTSILFSCRNKLSLKQKDLGNRGLQPKILCSWRRYEGGRYLG